MPSRLRRGLLVVTKSGAALWALFWFIFALLSGAGEGIRGIFQNAPNALPGLVFLFSAVTAWLRPRVGGVLLLLCAVFTLLFFEAWKNVFVFLFLTLPPLVSGGFLLGIKEEAN